MVGPYHTRFFESEAEARSQFDAMKVALAGVVEAAKMAVLVEPDNNPLIGRLCQEFIEEFP
jgi:hypothetical protein